MKRLISFLLSAVMVVGMLVYLPISMETKAALALSEEQIVNYFNGRVGESYTSNACLAFVADGFQALGAERSSACCAYNYALSHIVSYSRDIPLGADVFFSSEGCKYDYIDGNGHHSGHIGVYVGDGYMVHAYSGRIQRMLVSTVESHGYTYIGWGYHGGISISPSSNITISNETYPSGEHPQGKNFGIHGVINSANPLTRVWGGVFNADGSPTAQYSEDAPGTTSYDLYSVFDSQIIFGDLPIGSYIYSISATDSRGATVEVIRSAFTVVNTMPSSITIEGETYPTGHRDVGRNFGVYGRITSTYPLARVWGGVYHADGTATEQFCDAAPNWATYDLYQHFDPYIIFDALTDGDYVYQIDAQDAQGYAVTLVRSEFTVGAGTPSSISITGLKLPPATLEMGSGSSIAGTITSALPLTSVWGGVYDTNGAATAQYFDVAPSSTQFDLGTITDRVDFSKLPEGSYVYKIMAKDKKGTSRTLTECAFTVFKRDIVGDIDDDRRVGVTDVILLQKWLLASKGTNLPNATAADLDKNGTLDVFDLALLKRLVVK